MAHIKSESNQIDHGIRINKIIFIPNPGRHMLKLPLP